MEITHPTKILSQKQVKQIEAILNGVEKNPTPANANSSREFPLDSKICAISTDEFLRLNQSLKKCS